MNQLKAEFNYIFTFSKKNDLQSIRKSISRKICMFYYFL